MKNNYPTPTVIVLDTGLAKCLCTSGNPGTLSDYNEATIINETF